MRTGIGQNRPRRRRVDRWSTWTLTRRSAAGCKLIPQREMTGPELRASLKEFGYSQKAFSEKSGSAISTVGNWVAGRWPVPLWVAWLFTEMRKVKTLRDVLA